MGLYSFVEACFAPLLLPFKVALEDLFLAVDDEVTATAELAPLLGLGLLEDDVDVGVDLFEGTVS